MDLACAGDDRTADFATLLEFARAQPGVSELYCARRASVLAEAPVSNAGGFFTVSDLRRVTDVVGASALRLASGT